MRLEYVDFDTILPYWKILWPHLDEILPVSLIDFGGNINHSLTKYQPTFITLQHNNKIVGVNSFVQTSDHFGRNRGIWLDPNERNKGYGRFLLFESEFLALKNNLSLIWSMPRNDALNFYLRLGFEQATKLFNKYEFGPHCFVFKRIRSTYENNISPVCE